MGNIEAGKQENKDVCVRLISHLLLFSFHSILCLITLKHTSRTMTFFFFRIPFHFFISSKWLMFPLLWTDYRCAREDLSISCLPLLVISPFPLSIILTPSSFHHLLLFSSGIYRVAPDASTSLLCWSPAHAGFPAWLSLCIMSSSTSSISLSSQQTTVLSVCLLSE